MLVHIFAENFEHEINMCDLKAKKSLNVIVNVHEQRLKQISINAVFTQKAASGRTIINILCNELSRAPKQIKLILPTVTDF